MLLNYVPLLGARTDPDEIGYWAEVEEILKITPGVIIHPSAPNVGVLVDVGMGFMEAPTGRMELVGALAAEAVVRPMTDSLRSLSEDKGEARDTLVAVPGTTTGVMQER